MPMNNPFRRQRASERDMMARVCPSDAAHDAEMRRLLDRMDGVQPLSAGEIPIGMQTLLDQIDQADRNARD